MTRAQLIALIRGKDKTQAKAELVNYLQSPEGQQALGLAPLWLQAKQPEEVAELLLSEVKDNGQDQTAITH